MKLSQSSRAFTFCVLATALAAAALGCASHPTAKTTAESMGVFGSNTAKGKDSVDAAIGALEKLTASNAPDIRANASAYSQAVAALDAQAKTVKADADKMKANGDAFFKNWTGSEKVTPERRAALSASYDKIKQEMAGAKESFAPFLASLKDVDSYVNLDPTVKGINSVAPLVAKAKADGVAVNAHLDAVLTQVNSVRGMLTTNAK